MKMFKACDVNLQNANSQNANFGTGTGTGTSFANAVNSANTMQSGDGVYDAGMEVSFGARYTGKGATIAVGINDKFEIYIQGNLYFGAGVEKGIFAGVGYTTSEVKTGVSYDHVVVGSALVASYEQSLVSDDWSASLGASVGWDAGAYLSSKGTATLTFKNPFVVGAEFLDSIFNNQNKPYYRPSYMDMTLPDGKKVPLDDAYDAVFRNGDLHQLYY